MNITYLGRVYHVETEQDLWDLLEYLSPDPNPWWDPNGDGTDLAEEGEGNGR